MVQTGDAEAFGTLYDRHASRALRVAQSITHSSSRAEDAVQDGFLAIWRARASYQPASGAFRAWAMRIVRNNAIDTIRYDAAGHRPKAGGDEKSSAVIAPGPDLQDEAITRNENEALRESLRRLPDAQAEVIGLAYFGELTHSEIATELDLPPGTVKGRMRLGLDKLRREMASASADVG